ncbi:MAG TPA: ABC transporter permease [Vicinamibacteria bacterium]|jgi:putative ABC transport system permease protein|nr:ABC transporter permease [Vicinamibacteria bacterium]
MRTRLFRVPWTENVGFALGAMRSQKLRSFLTLLGVMAGVATVIMMVSFVVGFNNQVTAAFTAFGTHLVQFQKYEPRFGGPGGPPEEQRNRRDLTVEDARALKRLSTLVAAVSQERYIFSNVTVKAGKEEANSPLLLGTNPDYSPANSHFIQDGRFLTDADLAHGARVCVIGVDVADALYPHRDPIGQVLTVNGRAYQVIGLFEKKGSFFGGSNDNFVTIPITAFDDQFPEIKNGGGDTIHIATVPARAEDYQALIEEETAILRTRRGLRPNQANDFAIFTSEGQLRDFQQITGGVAAAMIVIAAIALVVGGVGVMNIMLVNVTQRTREIGLRKALGATRRDIATQFLTEAVTLTGVGGALGIGLGLSAALAARLAFDFQAAAPAWSVLLGFGVSTAVGLLFGMWPAIKAARQDPIEALRYE